jgi:predicted aminopeptidase
MGINNICKLLFTIHLLSGCYYLNSSLNHAKILARAQNIEKFLSSDQPTEDEKKKLVLTLDVLKFVEDELKIDTRGNYQSYSRVDGEYVTYLLTVAKRWDLEVITWSYPIVGRLPYRGFITLEDAKKEAASFDPNQFDTNIRGVTAYSTLGWFRDPVLSTMIRYRDIDYVETIIHELIHANIFIKDEGDLNEQLATFMGVWGAKLFYKHKLGEGSYEVKALDQSLRDRIAFSKFIKATKNELSNWYKNLSAVEKTSVLRDQKFQTIINLCKQHMQEFQSRINICEDISNNAKLLAYGVYYEQIENLGAYVEQNRFSFPEFLEFLKANKDNPKKIKNDLFGN